MLFQGVLIGASVLPGLRGCSREHLFNLVQDPREEKDLSKVEAHADKLLEWRQQLIKRLKNRPEGFVQNGKLIAGRPYGPLNAGTLSK